MKLILFFFSVSWRKHLKANLEQKYYFIQKNVISNYIKWLLDLNKIQIGEEPAQGNLPICPMVAPAPKKSFVLDKFSSWVDSYGIISIGNMLFTFQTEFH